MLHRAGQKFPALRVSVKQTFYVRKTVQNVQHFPARRTYNSKFEPHSLHPFVDSRTYAYQTLRLIKYYYVAKKNGMPVEDV